jgi:hypothetical protein
MATLREKVKGERGKRREEREERKGESKSAIQLFALIFRL